MATPFEHNRGRFRVGLAGTFVTLAATSLFVNVLVPLGRELLPLIWSLDWMKIAPIAISSTALYVAINNFRHSHQFLIKLRRCRSGLIQDRLSVEPYEFFEVQIVNLGLPLRNGAIALVGSVNFGFCTLQIPRINLKGQTAEPETIERGMIATFQLRSFEQTEVEMIHSLAGCGTRLGIAVVADGYEVFRIKIRRWRRLRKIWAIWQRVARAVSNWFGYYVVEGNERAICHRVKLPSGNLLIQSV